MTGETAAIPGRRLTERLKRPSIRELRNPAFEERVLIAFQACHAQKALFIGLAGGWIAKKGAHASPVWSSTRNAVAYVPARSSIACSKTLQPAVMCSGLADSISLWLMPSLQGMKIMPVGASLAMYTASCPAPETAGMLE